MRIFFVNLHTNTFMLKNLRCIITGQRAIDKHMFILKWMLENNIQVCNLITFDGSSLPAGSFLKRITRSMFFRKLEAQYVINKSAIPLKKIKIVTDYRELLSDDLIIYYSHFPYTQFDVPLGIKGVKLVDHIHFYGDKRTSDLIKHQKIDNYVCEVDLSKFCPIFNKNYEWFKGTYILRKFAYQPRFQYKKEFNSRKNKAVAIGTLTKCDLEDFVEFFGNDIYQPKRKMILDNVDILSDVIDSYISNYQETPRKIITKSDLFLIKFYKKIYNYFTNGKQKKYFSFDIVEKYNDYKMFICPEDAVGSYGIGVIEGMACGCAMIGCNYGVYEELGMIGGIHYIPYDGTVEGLKSIIEFYQKPENQIALEKIAEAGCKYVRENFSQDIVAKEYYHNLEMLVKNNANYNVKSC